MSKLSRPVSASTRKSRASKVNNNGSLKKSGRGLGYFGDDNDKIKEMQ